MSWRAVIIGGGISGLAAAHRWQELAPEGSVALLEAGSRLGGALETLEIEGALVEQGADSFITNVPAGVELCQRIGFADQLIGTREEFRRAMIVRHGKLYPVPAGFTLMAPQQIWPLLASPLLSVRGKLRMLAEWFLPARPRDDETLDSFVRRRLGNEAMDRLVQPLVSGIYTADPTKLSLAATLPRFLEMERQHGGLIRGALAQRKRQSVGQDAGARYGLFVTPRQGLSSLVSAVAARLPAEAIQLNTSVTSVRRESTRWVVTCTSGHGSQELAADAVIFATPAFVTATLLRGVDSNLAEQLEAIPYASSGVVSLGLRREAIGDRLDSFGFVVPAVERREVLAASFPSVKFPGRAPAGVEVIRVFIGGPGKEAILDRDDREILEAVMSELRPLLKVSGQPLWFRVARWRRSMPQYHLGHLTRVAEIESRVAKSRGLALAGAALRGVGIPHCIAAGERAAESARDSLNRDRSEADTAQRAPR